MAKITIVKKRTKPFKSVYSILLLKDLVLISLLGATNPTGTRA